MKETKFKVGDKVRVKTDLVADSEYNGLKFNSRMTKYCGKEGKISRIDCAGDYVLDFDRVWYWNDAMLEAAGTFTKSELKDGMVVENRGGDRELVLGRNMVDDEGYHSLHLFRDDLTHTVNDKADIVKVYTVKDVCTIDDIFEDRYLTLIWDRKEEECTLKYKVGDRVKVISDLKSHSISGRIGFVSLMREYLGRTLTIASLEETYPGGTPHYHVKENNWNWSDEMFEGLVDYEEMTVAEIEKKLGYKVKIVDGE